MEVKNKVNKWDKEMKLNGFRKLIVKKVRQLMERDMNTGRLAIDSSR